MNFALLTISQGWGGTEAHTVKLAEALVTRGTETAIVQLGHDHYQLLRQQPREGIALLSLNLPKRPRAMGYGDWRRLLRDVPGDVGVLAKGDFALGNFTLDLAARRRFGRFFTIEHLIPGPIPDLPRARHLGGLVPGLGLWRYRWRWRGYLRSLAPQKTICVSDAIRNCLLRDYFFPRRKVLTVHNGTNPERFRPDPECRRSVRKAWGIEEDCLVFGAVGRLAVEKGYDIAVEQLARFRAAEPGTDARLVLVGQGPEEERLRGLARQHGVEPWVQFPGFSDRPWEALCGLDVFLMPSRSEGLPLALCEAMATGRVCVAMGIAGVPEVLTDPKLGWLVPPGDAEGFLAAMRAASRLSPGERNEMGRQAREHIAAHFDERRQFAALAEILEGRDRSASGGPFRRSADSTIT